MMILALLDSSGNDINVDLFVNNPTVVSGPYTPFADVGVNGAQAWEMNRNDSADFVAILKDTSTSLTDTWEFYKIMYLRGTQIRMFIHNNDGAAAGTISTAYLRLV